MTKDMSSLPDHVKAFNDELAEMLTQKPPVSSSKMKDITRSAMKGQKYYKHIVMSVEKLIQKCKPEFKLSGVYVIDAIVRQSRHQNKERDVYAGRFESNIHITATHLFKCTRSDQVKICRTFKLWELNAVFSYHSMQKCLNNTAPDIRKEGIQLAERAKMAVKPVSSDILKQQKELEEQRKKIQAQEEELKKKQEALLQQQTLTASSTIIPPILGNLLHFGASQQVSETVILPGDKDKETANKVKSLLDDFDYSDEDEIKQPGKKGTPKSKTASPPVSVSTPKKTENVSTPSPVITIHDTSSLYEPDPPEPVTPISKPKKPDKTYDTKSLEKLYTPSPIEKTNKRTKHKSPERIKEKKSHKSDRSSRRESDKEKSRDRSRDHSERDASRERERDTSRDRLRESTRDTLRDTARDMLRDTSRDMLRDTSRDTSRHGRRSSTEGKRTSKSTSRGKRSRSTSPDHYSKKRDKISKPDCVSVLSTTIWIGNLRKTVTKEDISSLMKKYTDSCTIDMVPPRGCSYINIGDRDIAETALKELKDLKLHGAPCKVAWAPGKGCKEHKDHWNIDKGVTYIPYKTFEKLKIASLEDGGMISEPTLPPGFKLQESEGAGSILEKLLVSMKGSSHEETTLDNPLGQFLTNGGPGNNDNIAQQEQQVSAKLDKLNDIAIPVSATSEVPAKPRDEDSIVHLLNSKEYSLPMPDNNAEDEEYYYPDHPGMSPPVTLDIPDDVRLDETTSPVIEEPLPYSRPVDPDTPVAEQPANDSPVKAEKKTINLQTYLKRKKEDDLVEPARTESPEEEPVLPPTPVKTPREHDVDDLLEWASQDSQAIEEDEVKITTDNSPQKSPEEMDTEEPVKEVVLVEEEKKEESVEKEEPVEKEDTTIIADDIRSPSGSPVDSLLEEKLTSPAVEPGEVTPEAALITETSEVSSETPITIPSVADVALPTEPPVALPSIALPSIALPSEPAPTLPSDNNMEEGELEPDTEDEKLPDKTNANRSRSQSHNNKKMKKDKKKKKKNKKKRDKSIDSDLEEDIRKLEFLKAELEREERREKREKDRRRERKRSASPRLNKEKRKKEKRQRR